MIIVVTGSLGNISKHLVIALIEKGHMVTVISSDPQKRNEIEALGARAAIGKVDDADFLTAVFRGADIAYCMVPPDFTVNDPIDRYQTIGNSYAKAISKAGTKRVIHLSTYGAHLYSGTGLISGSNRVETALNTLDIQITHIRPTFFYYNLFTLINMIKAVGFLGSIYGGEDKLTMVSPKDIAAAIVDEIEHPGDSLTNYFNEANTGLPTVKYLANRLGISPSYLRDLLKNLTGKNTQQHIHDHLIGIAKEQLTTTNLSVSEIAYKLGFEHAQSFSKLFKLKTQQSPLEFKAGFN